MGLFWHQLCSSYCRARPVYVGQARQLNFSRPLRVIAGAILATQAASHPQLVNSVSSLVLLASIWNPASKPLLPEMGGRCCSRMRKVACPGFWSLLP